MKLNYEVDKEKTVVNFPTKWHFKYPSKIEWIEAGLKDFVKTYKTHNINSVAFPKLGTLNGGLDWNKVKSLMEKYLSNLDIPVYICLDNKKEAEGLEKEMLDIFNNLDVEKLKQHVRLTTSQINIFKNNISINRFWKINELDGIGTTTYKNIFIYCKAQTKITRFKHITLFDK